MPSLGPASDGPLSWLPGLGAAKDGARYGVAGMEAPLQSSSMCMTLEAKGEAPATGSSSTCSQWGGWQRTSAKDSSSSLQGMEAPQGMVQWHGGLGRADGHTAW